MSLFLGNLSAHIHQEDLEHVFRRFGRCSVRMKDGYGFVVFEEPFNAEKALRALRGKLICGEQINLSWSNKQPHNFQKFARNNRFHEPYRRRSFRDGDVNLNSEHGRRSFARHQTNNQRPFRRTDFDDRQRGQRQNTDFVGDAEVQKSAEKANAPHEFDPDEDGRWGEPVSNAVDDGLPGNGSGFDRYQPNRDYDAKDFDGNTSSGSYKSPVRSKSPLERENSDNAQLKHLDNLRQQPVCYNCGLLGHIMRNCPRGGPSRIDKSNRFRERRFHDNDEGRGEAEPNRKKYDARREAGRDALYYEQRHEASPGDRKPMLKGRHRFVDAEDTPRNKKREVDLPTRRNGKIDRVSTKKHLKKRMRHPSASFDTESKDASSLIRSASSGSGSKTTTSNSRSMSSRPSNSHVQSSESRSVSVSSHSRSKQRKVMSGLRSVSKSRSRSRSRMSIPESLSSSLIKKSASDEHKVGARDSDAPSFNDQKYDASNVKSGDLKENTPHPTRGPAFNAVISGTSKDIISVPCDKYQDTAMETENFSESDALPAAMDSNLGLDMLSGNGDKVDTNVAVPLKSNMGTIGAPDQPNSVGFSTSEMITVLNHYGLDAPTNNEDGLTAGTFFGAVRFWPWELIYYRRLKKGPISTENYARRVQQNKDFGIVDKYIRSSSGWGVSSENDM